MKLWIITKEKLREESQQVSLVSSNITNLRRARAVVIKQVVVEPLYWTESSSMFRKRRRHLRSIRERGEQYIKLPDDEEQEYDIGEEEFEEVQFTGEQSVDRVAEEMLQLQ